MKKIFSLLLLLSLGSCQSEEELKREQYFAEGFQLYKTNCANCHQDDGSGMVNLYPPINKPLIWRSSQTLACVIKNGMRDTIFVNGKEFSRPMPGNPKLTELEIAEIVTYMRVKWAGDSTYMHIDEVKKQLNQCQFKAL